jgi:uncharacterized protein YbjQ (UPF0145 family)
MTNISGLSGNEIYCITEKGYTPGNIVVGNSVYSLGVLRSIGSGFKALLGGELQEFTRLIEEGREVAYKRMVHEAEVRGGMGIAGVNSELIFHGANIEFLSMGSILHAGDQTGEKLQFSTCADGQELYAQLDAGYKPICFAFGNVAYSMGVGRGIMGGLRTLARGEVTEYSDIFNHTRHLALERIIKHAAENKANAVVGIKTTILPFSGVKEMLMIGTASFNPQLAGLSNQKVVTSDLTNQELWNLAKIGYAPMRLVLGTSVYSLGVIGGITSLFKSFVRGEISELTQMIYAARENALGILRDEAKDKGADQVVGVKTYVYNLGNGLIEFLAIGTAVKKSSNIKTESSQLPPQVFVNDKDTFLNMADNAFGVDLNAGTK